MNSYINGIKNEEKSAMEIKKMIATEGWKGSREFNLYPGTAELSFLFLELDHSSLAAVTVCKLQS